jgi:sugar lactone lactonase YvrE
MSVHAPDEPGACPRIRSAMSDISQQPEVAVDCACVTGENPLWHPEDNCVYWTDIPAGRLHRYDPITGLTQIFEINAQVGGFTIQEDGALLLFMERGAVKSWQDGRFIHTFLENVPDELDNRFNDVIADPEGRVFCGTMSTPNKSGRLYRLDRDRTLTVLLEGIGTSNGMGFTPDRKHMYYTDTRQHEIYLFDYDQSTGDISNKRVFAEAPDNEGGPDGLTVDAEGCVWSARWGGSRIVHYAPDGTEIGRIMFPADKISSLTFGGPENMDIYVTSAGGDNRPGDGEKAGALFHINCGVKGVPEFRSRILS